MNKPWIKSAGFTVFAGFLFLLSAFINPAANLKAAEEEEKETIIIQKTPGSGQDEDSPTYQDYEESKYGKVKLGLKGGLNVTTLYNAGGEVTDDKAKLGFHFGGYAQAPLTKFLAIQPELLFSVKGNSTDYKFGSGFVTPGTGTINYNLYYLEMPVLAVLNIAEHISVMAGPYAALLLGADVSNKSQNSDFNRYEELNRGDFNSIDYGLTGAVNFDINKMWDVGLRYNHGLRNIGKDGVSGELLRDARNAAFQVYLGVYF